MSPKKKFLVACMLLGNLLAPFTVHAEGPDPLSIYVQAGIDPHQHAQITDMAAQLESVNMERSHEIIALLKTIRALSLQPDLDEKKIISAQNRINDLQGAMAVDRLKLNIKVRKILTADQRNRLVAILREQRAAAAQSNSSIQSNSAGTASGTAQ